MSTHRSVPARRLGSTAARLALIAVVALLAAACATVPPSQNLDRVSELIDMINSAPVESVVEQSGEPFLFDAELVVRTSDVELIWTGLRDAGVRISPEIASMSPVEPMDYRRVADTFDLQVYFSGDRYLPRDAAWVETDSSVGPVLLLLGGRSGQLPLIYGFVRVDR